METESKDKKQVEVTLHSGTWVKLKKSLPGWEDLDWEEDPEYQTH